LPFTVYATAESPLPLAETAAASLTVPALVVLDGFFANVGSAACVGECVVPDGAAGLGASTLGAAVVGSVEADVCPGLGAVVFAGAGSREQLARLTTATSPMRAVVTTARR
jgi:hypothetical protein